MIRDKIARTTVFDPPPNRDGNHLAIVAMALGIIAIMAILVALIFAGDGLIVAAVAISATSIGIGIKAARRQV